MSYSYQPSRKQQRDDKKRGSMKSTPTSAKVAMSPHGKTVKIVGILVVVSLIASGVLMSVGTALTFS